MIFRKLALFFLFVHAVVFGLMAFTMLAKSDATQFTIFSALFAVCILLLVITLKASKKSRRSEPRPDLLEFIELRKEEAKEDNA